VWIGTKLHQIAISVNLSRFAPLDFTEWGVKHGGLAMGISPLGALAASDACILSDFQYA
jgi:hypothetical protein